MANNRDQVQCNLRDVLELRQERDQLRAELARLQRNEDCVQRLIVWAAENGWNGVDNSKILDSFIVGLFDELRAELAETRNKYAVAMQDYSAKIGEVYAELAAAKNLLARIHRDGGHHTETVGFAQSVADAGDKVSEWLLAAEERTALTAHVERLREKGFKMRAAISGAWSADRMTSVADSLRPVIQDHECDREALAATPAQCLAAHDAAVKVAVLREVVEELRDTARERDDSTYDIAAYMAEEKANLISKEAANGQA